jgi:hypothetical protein
MFIYVDESGLFVPANDPKSYSVVAAFALPERQLPKLELLMGQLRGEFGGREVKLKDLPEARYLKFLKELSRIGGLAFAMAVDTSLHPPALVEMHRNQQVAKILEHIGKVNHEAARAGLREWADSIKALPVQLYTQLQIQISLFHKVVCRSSLYFAQHSPDALEYFRWRIDQKNTIPTAYEIIFRKILPPAVQTISMTEPLPWLDVADYSYFKRFEFAPGERPRYLQEVYGLPEREGIDAKKILSEDFELEDSELCSGVQAADLLAAGVRRLLRGGFARAHEAALLLGANMLSGMKGESVIDMLSLGNVGTLDAVTAKAIKTVARGTKPLIC